METSSAVETWRLFTRRGGAVTVALFAALFALGLSRSACAQGTIKHPGDHPDYSVELEPHALLGLFNPPGNTDGTGLGLGLRATIPIVKNGFVSTINNSVGISFGFDWLHYSGHDVSIGPCVRWVPGPAGTNICTQVGGYYGGPANYVFLPVAMQWNFWLHEQFSAFGEPGLVIYYRKASYEPDGGLGLAPMLEVGGRWHFSKMAALTFRMGYPTFSLGVSFFL